MIAALDPMPDLLQISLGTTRGLRVADAWFAELAARGGVGVETVGVRVGATRVLRRAYPVTDLVEALAARRAATTALARIRARAVVFSTTTAAMLAPEPDCPYAVRLDSPARLNRPGVRNAPLHALERRRLSRARLLLPTSSRAAAALPAGFAPAVVVPPPIAVQAEAAVSRQPVAVAYTPDPKAKGLDLLCRAWKAAALPDAHLEVFGIDPGRARSYLDRKGVPEPPGVRWRGSTSAREFHATLGNALAFVTSARWEDFGMAQLEALALGTLLVCTAAEGPFEAGAIAAGLAPELVAADRSPEALAVCIRRAFQFGAGDVQAYAAAARTPLEPYRPAAVARTIAERVLPALL